MFFAYLVWPACFARKKEVKFAFCMDILNGTLILKSLAVVLEKELGWKEVVF